MQCGKQKGKGRGQGVVISGSRVKEPAAAGEGVTPKLLQGCGSNKGFMEGQVRRKCVISPQCKT